jgi:Ca2+-binding RTX toxin-like protein
MKVCALLLSTALLVGVAVAPAGARIQATEVGYLATDNGVTFRGKSGVNHAIVVRDDGELGFPGRPAWRITTLSRDTTIGNLATSAGCDKNLFGESRVGWRCAAPLTVNLGDLDDHFVSTARTTAGATAGLIVDAGTGRDVVQTGPLDDKIFGGAGNDVIHSGEGDDELHGHGGDDVFRGQGGADDIDGGEGVDTVAWPGGEGIVVTLADALANDGRADESDKVLNVENVEGTPAGDTITGSNVVNRLDGRDGNDRLFGLFASDILLGMGGSDRLDGGWGDDVLEGGDGSDTLLGGFGADRLLGGAGDDTLEGGPGAFADRLLGGAGDDVLRGGFGADLYEGGDGNDTIHSNDVTPRADTAVDVVKCGAGVDTVYLGPEDHADTDCENVIPG